MTQVLLFCGSQRRDSYNARLLQHMAWSLQWQCACDTLLPQDVALPLFDQDLEHDAATVQRVHSVAQRFARCDALVVACPEYNGQATPYLKNTVDWVTRLQHLENGTGAHATPAPFLDKPVLLCSASTGWSGGALAIVQLRALFGYVGANVLGPSISVAHAEQRWSDAGYSFSASTEAHIDYALQRLLAAAGSAAVARTEAA